MNEGQLSAETAEVVSQSGSATQISALSTEIVSQSTTPSPINLSAMVIEVIEIVPRVRVQMLTTFN